MDLRSVLKQRMASWDGKSTDVIHGVYAQFCDEQAFVEQIVNLLADSETQVASSWLVKAWLEDNKKRQGKGLALSQGDNRTLLMHLSSQQHWQSKLHLLQIFEYLRFEPQHEKQILAFVRACMEEQNKFVRAWAYHGYFYLARQFEHYREDVMDMFEMALSDEPASVKARVKKLKKAGFD